MKKILLTFCIVALAFSACVKDDYDYKGEIDAIKAQLASQKAMIDMLQKAVTVTDIKKGTDSFTITFSNGDSYTITNGYTPLVEIGENGNWFINGEDTGEPSKGKDGRDGYTCKIEIGADGFWYIDGVNTGVKAAGLDGKDGRDGVDGKDGEDGTDGMNGTDGQDGEDGLDGKDGVTPTIEIINGYWYINGTNTGVKAVGQDGRDGQDGQNGADGKNGVTPTIEIGPDGCWYINGKSTGLKAVAVDGLDGKDAPYITSIVENFTYFTFIFSDGSSIDVIKEAYAYVSSERVRTSLEAAAIIQLGKNCIRANTIISAALSFDEFKGVQLGRGYRVAGGWMLEIGTTEMKVSKYENTYSVVETFAHGLNVSGPLYVSIEETWDGSTISLYCNGREFRAESSWNAAGAPFVYNNNGSGIDVDLTFFPYDVKNSVWIMGDDTAEDWIARLHDNGASPLVDWMSGATAAKMFTNFKNDLHFGNPDFVLWALGSNNKADTDAVDPAWLSATESFIELCEARGITPVLATIPSSDGNDHSLKSAWVKASGCRYVDFAAAATDAGARAYRLLVDLPEVMQK